MIFHKTRIPVRHGSALTFGVRSLCLGLFCASCMAQSPAASSSAPETTKTLATPHHGLSIDAKQLTVPLVIIRGLPFIEGSLNGRKGKLLFDVGEASALLINSHAVTPPNGIVTGRGFFGSGQTFETFRFPLVDELTLAGELRFTKMTNIAGNPGLPLEQNITSDFLGWIGIDFWKGYAFKLDYAKPSVMFYRNDAPGAGIEAAAAGEHAIQTIQFDNTGHRNLPVFPISADGIPIVGGLDTGNHNVTWLNDSQIKAMKQAGTLQKTADGTFTLSGIKINGHLLPTMPVKITPGRAPFAKQLPQPNAPFLSFGYEFFALYKTIWDFDQSTITLLEP